jgi:hypothetical protein
MHVTSKIRLARRVCRRDEMKSFERYEMLSIVE